MASEKLTKTAVDAARPRTDRPGSDLYLWDTGRDSVAGFGLKVTPTGSKSFVFQYRMRAARNDRRYKIGRYGDWTVDGARDRAKKLRIMVDSGTDPLEHDRALAKAAEQTKQASIDRAFSTVADNWLAAYKLERRLRGARKGRVRSASTILMAEAAVEFLKAQFRNERIDEIDDARIMRAIEKIPASKAATRRNTFASARVLWKWAMKPSQRLVTDNPFDKLDVPPAPEARERTLSDSELRLVWLAARSLPYPFGPAYCLLALTGQRLREVMSADWSEFNRDAREWRIPAARTKNGVPHIVPLPNSAITQIDALAPLDGKGKPKWPTNGFVFTVTGKTAVSGYSSAKRQLDKKIAELAKKDELEAPAPWRIHDLRRTIATGFQRLGIRFEVTEAALNHVSGSRGGIAGIYQKHDWAKEKSAALAAWANHIDGLLIEGDDTNVVRLEVA